mgnify:FL=1
MGEIFDESHYFICSNGMKPARMRSNQKVMLREDGKYYLTERSLTCIGADFSCRWIALVAAILCAAIALLCASGVGVVLLAALVGAAAGAFGGMALCGGQAAVMRVWVSIKTDMEIYGCHVVVNRPGIHMTCGVFSGQISYAPNVKNVFDEYFMFGYNILGTGLEGFMYVYAFRGAGLLAQAPKSFLCNFGVNYLKQYTVNGILMRSAFSSATALNAYYNSATEGWDGEEVGSAALQSFFFTESALINFVSKRDVRSGILLISMGGIPGGGRGVNRTGKISDLDVTSQTIGNIKNRLGTEWKRPNDVIKDDLISLKAKVVHMRDLLRTAKKGEGVSEMRKMSFEEFADSFDSKNLSESALKEIYDLYLKNEWSILEDRFKDMGEKWPPGRGASFIRTIELRPGQGFDRLGGRYENGVFKDGGEYGGKVNTPYTNRALAPGSETRPYKVYEVTKPIPNVQEGEVAPWFGEEGGGTQYDLKGTEIKDSQGRVTIDEMKNEEYIREKKDQSIVLPNNRQPKDGKNK